MQPRSGGHGRSAPALTRLALAHPWSVLSTWLVIVAVLGAIGLGIDGKLSAGSLQVSNSESERARALIGGNFGDAATVPVLLRGPRSDVKQQGKALASALAKRPGVRVLSPWTASSGRAALRPSGDRALLLLSVSGTHEQIDRRSHAAQQLVAQSTSAPVRATVTGLPLLTRDGTRSSLAAVHTAELIALPLLLLALLLVFRSPLAAAIPVAFGAATIAASTGVLTLLADHVQMDAFALAVSCMVGLALAVDYSLLMVSRVRDELSEHRGGDVKAIVARAAAPTMRTVAAAAAVIVVAMAVAGAMSPGSALLGAAVGISLVAVVSAIAAMVAVPAMLIIVGHRLDHAAVASTNGCGASARLAQAAARRPALGIVAVLVLLLASIPVLGLRTGAPAAQSLPSGSDARAQYDTVSREMGAGWTEPFELVAVTRRGAVTTPKRLAELARVQRKIALDPAVRAVLGPGAIAGTAAKLRSAGRRAVGAGRSVSKGSSQRLKQVDKGVSSAANGVDSLRNSLSSANAAASRIESGSRDLQGGVGALQDGLSGAGSGARQLASKLAAAGRGASGLSAQTAAAGGAVRALRSGVRDLNSRLTAVARGARDLQGRLRNRVATLDRVRSGVRDQRRQADDALAAAERALPPYSAAAIRARAALRQARQALAADAGAALDEPLRMIGQDADYAGSIANATPAGDAKQLSTSVGRLADSAEAIVRRVRELGGTVGALSQGGDSLVKALDELDGGADAISSAFGDVRSGVDGLARGVRTGEQRTSELASGLNDARSAARGLGAAAVAPQTAAPKKSATASFFDSGYFLLAALESGNGGAPFGVNVDQGGRGARIVVVPRYAAADPRTQALYRRLRTISAELGTSLGAQTAVGGPAAVLSDYDHAAAKRLPLIVLVLTLVTALLLAILLRSVVVPIIGVVLNLLAVGATLGLLALLFQGDSPLLGGPGEIDAVALVAIFGVVFALSIDYQMFIVSRVREEWLRTGDADRAVTVGMARTARVVTGAALSMLGVFLAFAVADLASLRQFGVGLAIAVVIDATLVRLVLLPAALRLAGKWAWWTPSLVIDEPLAPPVYPEPEPVRSHY